MATAAEIEQLRANVNEFADEDPFSDEALGMLIDAVGVSAASSAVWRRKAAAVADLVNVSENGSSRSMGSVYSQYLAMAKEFDVEQTTAATTASPRTRRIVRP